MDAAEDKDKDDAGATSYMKLNKMQQQNTTAVHQKKRHVSHAFAKKHPTGKNFHLKKNKTVLVSTAHSGCCSTVHAVP